MNDHLSTIVPDWPVPAGVRALVTSRIGGISPPPYCSLNLGDHVADEPSLVAQNRARLRAILPAEPHWMRQVHGVHVVELSAQPNADMVEADAAISRVPGVVCAVLTADCLPVFLCDESATVVGVAHAGWRGLAQGVLTQTVAAMDAPPHQLMAWLGPAIGARSFEVGREVYDAFCAENEPAKSAFSMPYLTADGTARWHCNLYQLARLQLAALGLVQISGGQYCTFEEKDRFFSYRRDGVTGRMASLIWLA